MNIKCFACEFLVKLKPSIRLRGMDVLAGEAILLEFYLTPLSVRIYSERSELASPGASLFFEVYPVEGIWCTLTR